WQTLGWVLRIASVYWFLVAFGVPASMGSAALVVAVQLAAGALPLTPGGAGPQQAMLVVALSATTAASVLAFGIGMQAATVLTNIALGGVSLLWMTGSVRGRALPGSRASRARRRGARRRRGRRGGPGGPLRAARRQRAAHARAGGVQPRPAGGRRPGPRLPRELVRAHVRAGARTPARRRA